MEKELVELVTSCYINKGVWTWAELAVAWGGAATIVLMICITVTIYLAWTTGE